MKEKELEQIYTINEACDILKLSRVSIYNMIRDGKIKTIPFGKVQRIKESELIKILNGDQK